MRLFQSPRRLTVLIGCSLIFGTAFGQSKQWEIPLSIAKLPERSDFYGVWLRYDGTYRLEITQGTEPGSAAVKYFNPGSINVERAVFSGPAHDPVLTVVLVDKGYPGSTYTLVFVAENRILAGRYVRPGAEPSEVYFNRLVE